MQEGMDLDTIWVSSGYELGSVGEFGRAISCFRRAISLNPRNYWAWYYCGIMLRSVERQGEAMACFDRAIQLQRNRVEAWFMKLFQYIDLKQYFLARRLIHDIEGLEGVDSEFRELFAVIREVYLSNSENLPPPSFS